MRDNVRVAVIDDHPLFREGVAHTLRAEAGMEIVGEGTTAADALRLAQTELPDIMLLDVSIPGGGIHAARAIAAACPVVKIVMLTVSEEEDDVMAALKAGARAYILKGTPSREFVGILRAVCEGEVYVTPRLAASLLLEMRDAVPDIRAARGPLDELTERERQILERVSTGQSNKEIAYDLSLSEKTVKHYMTNILQKLQVRNRVEAGLLARKVGGAGPKP